MKKKEEEEEEARDVDSTKQNREEKYPFKKL